jgi:hypothetical protein
MCIVPFQHMREARSSQSNTFGFLEAVPKGDRTLEFARRNKELGADRGARPLSASLLDLGLFLKPCFNKTT